MAEVRPSFCGSTIFLPMKNQAEFTQYLNFSITQIDRDNKLSITGYGRVSQAIHGSDGLNGRLYFLYLNYRDLYDKIDLRLGRQFVNYAAGPPS